MALHVALIEPRIPPNTGNIARLCAAAGAPLHLIEPLGFSVDDKEVKRAGLDYWDKVDLWVHPDWFAFRDAIARDRTLYFSANATRDLSEAPFAWNSVLVFGNETDGMPDRILVVRASIPISSSHNVQLGLPTSPCRAQACRANALCP